MLDERLAIAYRRGDDDTIAKLSREIRAWEDDEASSVPANGQHCECCRANIFKGWKPDELREAIKALSEPEGGYCLECSKRFAIEEQLARRGHDATDNETLSGPKDATGPIV
jgi:hypothetical protein